MPTTEAAQVTPISETPEKGEPQNKPENGEASPAGRLGKLKEKVAGSVGRVKESLSALKNKTPDVSLIQEEQEMVALDVQLTAAGQKADKALGLQTEDERLVPGSEAATTDEAKEPVLPRENTPRKIGVDKSTLARSTSPPLRSGEAAPGTVPVPSERDGNPELENSSDSIPAVVDVIQGKDGWPRTVIKTPLKNVDILFHGGSDLPILPDTTPENGLFVSVAPLGEGLKGGGHAVDKVASDVRVDFANSHNSDPRQPLLDVVGKSFEKAAEAGEDKLALMVPETPLGFARGFAALREAGLPVDQMSDTARKLAEVADLAPEKAQEANGSELAGLAAELYIAGVSTNDGDMSSALQLVWGKHIGVAKAREACGNALQQAYRNKYPMQNLEVSQQTKEVQRVAFIEATKANQDFFVHRDLGVLRPGDKLLPSSAHTGSTRNTIHGAINVAIDTTSGAVWMGGGEHGKDLGNGSTTVASPMDELVKMNKMPSNFNTADTFFDAEQGLELPKGSIYITRLDELPGDVTSSEIFIPQNVTEADVVTLVERIAGSDAGNFFDGTQDVQYMVESIMRERRPGDYQVDNKAWSALLNQCEEKLGDKRLGYDADPLAAKLANTPFQSGGEQDIKYLKNLVAGEHMSQSSGKIDKVLETAYVLHQSELQDLPAAEVISKLSEIITPVYQAALASERSRHLQTALTDELIKRVRGGKPTPKLESFGRGLDFHDPNYKVMERVQDVVAQAGDLPTHLHPNSPENAMELSLDGLKPGSEMDYAHVWNALRDDPIKHFELGVNLVARGVLSFDQVGENTKRFNSGRLV